MGMRDIMRLDVRNGCFWDGWIVCGGSVSCGGRVVGNCRVIVGMGGFHLVILMCACGWSSWCSGLFWVGRGLGR
jgi:hypothetical protein